MNHETFILTLFHDPARSSDLRGRIRHVASGNETTFVGAAELAQALQDFIRTKRTGQRFPGELEGCPLNSTCTSQQAFEGQPSPAKKDKKEFSGETPPTPSGLLHKPIEEKTGG